jgi:hypothetical protein
MAVSSVPWSQKAMMIHVSSSSFSLPLDRCAVPARGAAGAQARRAPARAPAASDLRAACPPKRRNAGTNLACSAAAAPTCGA